MEGISGGNAVKMTLNGDGEINLFISPEILKEDKSVVEDLIKAAHNNAKHQLKIKPEEISKATGKLGVPGFKGHIIMQI